MRTAARHAATPRRSAEDLRPPLTVCPACGAAAYEKQVTAAGFQLKGSGWYVTDFRGGNTGAAKDAKKDGDSTPSDGKPADGAPAPAPAADAKPAEAASPAPAPAPPPAPAASGSAQQHLNGSRDLP
jgi:putative FmdB family regulatory protein